MGERESLHPTYFERVYAESDDPWGFATRAYEAGKYAETLDALPRERYGSAFEIGCSIGVLTERLAACCEQLLAVDVAERALMRLIVEHLEPGGQLLLIHWTPFVEDYPLTGDQVHEAFLDGAAAGNGLKWLSGSRRETYRLDLFERSE